MFRRIVNPSLSSSFFLFGARGTGKSTYLGEAFGVAFAETINLLIPTEIDRYQRDPSLFSRQIERLEPGQWVLIDEIQRAPALLDLVHHHIEKQKIKFALTGSSARKLRHGSANLLAGRAFTYELFPLTFIELEDQFNLHDALRWGTLPRLYSLENETDKSLYLESYGLTYIQEEVWNEHLVRALPPFRRFIEIAAQMNGEILNFSRIAADVGADDKTVRSYFSILEDTLVGYMLEPHHTSVRKQQSGHPKFYFFDVGVRRSLDRSRGSALVAGSSDFGRAFEHLVLSELRRLSSYHRKNFSFSYLRTKDGAEIDLIIERPGMPLALVEIKSTSRISELDLKHLRAFSPDFPKSVSYCLSTDPKPQRFGNIEALEWREGIRAILEI